MRTGPSITLVCVLPLYIAHMPGMLTGAPQTVAVGVIKTVQVRLLVPFKWRHDMRQPT